MDDSDSHTVIDLIPADGARVARFVVPDTEPQGELVYEASLSPNGRLLAFASIDRVWVAPANKPSQATRVFVLPRAAAWGAGGTVWSQDGQRLVFSQGDALVFVAANGTGLRRLPTGVQPPVVDPVWSPDESRIVFVGDLPVGSEEGTIYSIGVDGRGRKEIAKGAHPDVSPDGSTLAFARGGNVFVVPFGGGRPRLVIHEAGHPAWSPDGRYLAFTRDVDCYEAGCVGRVFIAPANGGKARAYGPEIFDIGPLDWKG